MAWSQAGEIGNSTLGEWTLIPAVEKKKAFLSCRKRRRAGQSLRHRLENLEGMSDQIREQSGELWSLKED